MSETPKKHISPESLSFFGDFAKTIITLDTAVLAIIGTFLATAGSQHRSLLSLFFAAVALFLSLFCGIWSAGGIIGLSRTDFHTSMTMRTLAKWSNWSFWLLFVGLLLLGASIYFTVFTQVPSAKSAIDAAEAAPTVTGCNVVSDRQFESITQTGSLDDWQVLYFMKCAGSNGIKSRRLLITVHEDRIVAMHLY